jgi:hypothetical protein
MLPPGIVIVSVPVLTIDAKSRFSMRAFPPLTQTIQGKQGNKSRFLGRNASAPPARA